MRQWRGIAVGLVLGGLVACGGGGGGAPSGAANTPPVAQAGSDQTVNENTAVSLSGAASSDADGTLVAFAWTQTGGPTVSLGGASTPTATFAAPDVAATTVLEFQLSVTDNRGASASDRVRVQVDPVFTALGLVTLELAQTHVLPPDGLNWTLRNGSGTVTATESLHLTGGRAALALVKLSATDASNPRLEGRRGATVLGTVPLAPPAQLPPTEASGPAYASGTHSATLPGDWLRPGLGLRVLADNYTPSPVRNVIVGGDFAMTLRVLPFYVFGATETNTARPLTLTGAPDAATRQEILAKWPVTTLDASNHPAGKVQWPYLVIGPRGDRSGVAQPAYVASRTEDYRDGFAGMSAVLGVLGGLLSANGESPQAVQYYAPLLALNAAGAYQGPGGGLGGGSVGTGDEASAGIFIHEQGHAFGLPHVGEAFDQGRYPYEWGSLDGSAWGYDSFRREFLAPFLPATATRFNGCAGDTFGGHPRALDDAGRCVKQDPMQSGAGDQAQGYRFATFSDYSTGVMQRYFEGRTTLASDGVTHRYSGGKLVRDAAFPGGYKRWDTLDRQFVNVSPATTDGGIFGLEQNLPVQTGTPVYAIVVTLSGAGTTGATQIYPPIRYTGNLLRTIDPSQAEERARIMPDTGEYYWYCRNGGCDYTLRVSYAGGARHHVLLQGGFRPFNQARGTPPASASDPVDGNSFRRWVVNVPDLGTISRIELLSTPMVWEGMPATPAVLASR